ncbi:hypothetical protein PTI98_006667 [Pleurotus ostreatus]|nr:hypothetical protein PTI98_006667 [Pleurotus ostreatus]KAJ8696834.1 hypothetical protein PTI98_006667 [Pleurotus ostreatus]
MPPFGYCSSIPSLQTSILILKLELLPRLIVNDEFFVTRTNSMPYPTSVTIHKIDPHNLYAIHVPSLDYLDA